MLCHVGAEETLGSFTENLRGASAGDTRQFASSYPDDYPDPKLAGKSYDYTVEVRGIKEKKLPELNDEFAKDQARGTRTANRPDGCRHIYSRRAAQEDSGKPESRPRSMRKACRHANEFWPSW